jgi:hypothetical protein
VLPAHIFCAAVVVLGTAGGPALAATGEGLPMPNPSTSTAEACKAVLGKAAPATASPQPATPGAHLAVDIVWGPDWASSTVEVLGCTTIGGHYQDGLSTLVRRADNTGRFAHEFTVPEAATAGSQVCEQGAVIGRSASGAARIHRTDARCFLVAAGRVAAAAEPAAAPAPPSSPPVTPAAAPRTAEATTAAPPPAAATRTPEPLPRTGTAERHTTATAGLLLVLGGGAVALGSWRGYRPAVGRL